MKALAHFVSVLFHPLFVLTYLLIILLLVNPYLFSIQAPREKIFVILSVFSLSVFFPLFAMMLMKFLGLVQSFSLKTKEERIGPLIVTGSFYLWLFINLYKSNIVPNAFTIMVLGATIGLFIAFFINNFSKISLHAVGVGGFLGALFLIKLHFSYDYFYLSFGQYGVYKISMFLCLILGILISGFVCTSRLYLGAHQKVDIFGGLIVGIFAQGIAFRILL
jgi:membrane-associated phospholipid phosphatase